MKFIDSFLNTTTMYRLVLYGLTVMFVVSVGLAGFGFLSYGVDELFLSVGLFLVSCYATNYLFAKVLKVAVNVESVFITAFILFFIMPPLASSADVWPLALSGIAAMASKYLIAPIKRHIFNPAAFGVFFVFILNLGGATWWVASVAMLPVTLVVGLLIVRKIRRFGMLLAFLGAGVGSIVFFNYTPTTNFGDLLWEIAASWPIIFFGTVMLTEPITTPPTSQLRTIYAILVGLLFGSQFHFWRIIPTPEFVLLLGNIFSYAVGFKPKLTLTLTEKREVAKDIVEFVFSPDRKISFEAGQYLELTLPHTSDTRGNRRYFTIASAPTEEFIRFGIKMNTPPSSFKKALSTMELNTTIAAGQLAGDFTLPNDTTKKLVFLAGGIGVTPFRSMIKNLIDQREKRDVVLFYSAKSQEEVAYRDLFDHAREIVGLRTEYVVSRLVDESLIREKVPDFKDRIFYISGPEGMVNAFKSMLLKMGISRKDIVTDYFPGFA